jgi:hypothetical protein
MKIEQQISARLTELVAAGEKLLQEKNRTRDLAPQSLQMSASQWAVSTLSFLKRVFGEDSEHYKKFYAEYHDIRAWSIVSTPVAILRSAQDDYNGGYLFQVKQLITAEVFDDFLEEAEYLFNQNYY